MNLVTVVVPFVVFIAIAYFTYGRWLARLMDLNDSRTTPAHLKSDGEDFVPTKLFYLFGQHFSAIAAAGPIAGPIAACLVWGWLPALMWIALGVVLIGSVHDFLSLTASVRHGACSVAEVAKEHLGSFAGRSLMAFIWIALIYIIVAFADITSGSFIAKIDEIQGIPIQFNPGGAVAAASVFYLALSLILGVVQKWLKPPLGLVTVIFVPLTFVAVWCGTYFSEVFVYDIKTWGIILCVYCALATVCPVWLLLQPRGYLGGFVLYFAIAIGLFGVLFGGYEIKQPVFTGWSAAGATGQLFPFLFVTIACGACSGFHGLVCSGTTSKQIDRESHMHPVGYGAMLAEGLVAIMALAIVMMMSSDEVKGLRPGTIYGNGIGQFLALIIGRENLPLAITFGAMAFSTFVFDTLDVSTRLGRYLVQELLGWRSLGGALVGTLLTVGLPALILFNIQDGSWGQYWTLFGASNQLLAALTFVSLTLWLYKSRKRIAFTLIPMLFVLTITLWALIDLAVSNWHKSTGFDSSLMNSITAIALVVLAIIIASIAIYKAAVERRLARTAMVTSAFQDQG